MEHMDNEIMDSIAANDCGGSTFNICTNKPCGVGGLYHVYETYCWEKVIRWSCSC